MNINLNIDGKPVIIHSLSVTPDKYGYRLFIRRVNQGGPSSQHDVPSLSGKYFTNGHCYEFS